MPIPRSYALAACALSLLCAPAGRAQQPAAPPSITVGGEVLDAVSGAPVPDAAITLPRLGRSVFTDERGHFVLRGIPAGPQRWVVSRLGYATWDQEVNAAEDGAAFTARILARPEVLEGITVVADRFESRRRAAATSVRVADRRDILTSAAANAMELVGSRMGLTVTPCSASQPDVLCTWVRGRLARPTVFVDDQAPGYLEHLQTYMPHEIHVIEAYYGGEVIYFYTTDFVERLAKSGRALQPIPRAGRRAASYPSGQQVTPPTRGQTRLRGNPGGGRP
jgi:hypothetical protein